MKKYCLISLIFIFQGCSKTDKSNSSIEDNYEKEWRSPETSEFLPIGKVIVKNGTKGCGEYRLRKNITNENEYLIACTSDGINWKKYILDITMESINSFSSETSNPE